MDYVAAGLNILGLYLLARHRMYAMYTFLASSVMWAVWGLTTGTWSIVGLQVVLIVLNIRTIIHWRKERSV